MLCCFDCRSIEHPPSSPAAAVPQSQAQGQDANQQGVLVGAPQTQDRLGSQRKRWVDAYENISRHGDGIVAFRQVQGAAGVLVVQVESSRRVSGSASGDLSSGEASIGGKNNAPGADPQGVAIQLGRPAT